MSARADVREVHGARDGLKRLQISGDRPKLGAQGAVGFDSVYSEIASNKRRSVIFIALFFVIWLAIGAALRLPLQGRLPTPRPTTASGRPTDQLRLGPGHRRHGDLRRPGRWAGSSTP